ncbi:mycothiol transferase [Arthrobacter castelli]|uniref:mycothiol transferase n=1 Tax=Arthrobacter castelli TaxID=271431 RepID=UPI000408F75F|nr:DinB family protein [Arthrobacter castelli]
MDAIDVLLEAYGRIPGLVHGAAKGLERADLHVRPDGSGNSIAWLIWHLTRVQDDHIADAAGTEQLWTAEGWMGRFDLPLEPGDTGHGHSSSQVSSVTVDSPEVLLEYYNAVHRTTVNYVQQLSAENLDEVIDASWDPPTTLGVRLVSVMQDCVQHAAQAAYVRGLLS